VFKLYLILIAKVLILEMESFRINTKYKYQIPNIKKLTRIFGDLPDGTPIWDL